MAEQLTLKLKQSTLESGKIRVEISLSGTIPREAKSEFDFIMMDQDREDIRWYLEDYLQYPLDPAPAIASQIEKRMAKIGTELFENIFKKVEDATEIWNEVRTQLADTRIEILSEVTESAVIPWELLRDAKTDQYIALSAKSFVRGVFTSSVKPILPALDSGQIRILLVICRPSESEDVAFRSVASRLLKGLNEASREVYRLDVLRPATFESLAEKLLQAKAAGLPYHVVHFDGHGDYFDLSKFVEATQSARQSTTNSQRFSGNAYYPHEARAEKRGYLLFENPETPENIRFVDGTELGQLLRETGVSVLALNACRSARAEALEKPDPQAEGKPKTVHEQTRAYGSLALEIMDAGVAGVVAMRHSVYVVTAAQFVADLYSALVQGQSLGEAVSYGRKQLHSKPLREIAYNPIPLQDWCVPLVFEAAAVRLFPRQDHKAVPKLTLTTVGDGKLNDLPRPDAGFFGRDETLLALDRTFDSQHVVLLYAYAGSGKTMTAAEFARWYVLTHGLETGIVLWTSFEHHKPLARVLDDFGQVFDGLLQQNGIHWSALTEDKQRKNLALNVLSQIPVLWIWDNMEPINGFPQGMESLWSKPEQQELADFLKAAGQTKAKFLLTSRRDEHDWLHDLPMRIKVPPMPMQESMQLVRALADKHNHKITEVSDWWPLLRYTHGNPMTITVVVGQALKLGIHTGEQIEAYLDKLRAGEVNFEDDETQGRSKSLGASLNYGFTTAFTEDERKILALLHLFQGFVDVNTLKYMGTPKADWSLPEVKGLTSETGISLLDRAAEIGLLTAHGEGYYSIHPAVPWFFKREFDRCYPDSRALSATRAFVEAVGELGNYYTTEYYEGNRDVIDVLKSEEANLLYARRLARTNGWWPSVVSTMQGLLQLYGHTGRRAEWRRLVEEIVPDYVDSETGGPIAGREEDWSLVIQYRVGLAREERRWEYALHLQEMRVVWDRKRAEPFLKLPIADLTSTQWNAIRTLVSSLHEYGQVARETGQAICIDIYQESMRLAERIGDKKLAAACAFNLGTAYKNLPAIRDLAEAEKWYRKCIELIDPQDRLGRSKCLGQLGLVAYERFMEAHTAEKPEEESLGYLKEALKYYLEALDLTPPDAIGSLAVKHNQLGLIYADAGDPEKARSHYDRCIQFMEQMGDSFRAAGTRNNVAIMLSDVRRFGDALLYAEAALRNFETYGERAAAEIQRTKGLIARIRKDLNS